MASPWHAWDDLTDEELYARLEIEHGVEGARVVAKFMGLPPRPKKGRRPRLSAGAKPVPTVAIPVPRKTGSGGWQGDYRDMDHAERLDRLYVSRHTYPCKQCDQAVHPGDEVGMLWPSRRRVHAGCVLAALGRQDGP